MKHSNLQTRFLLRLLIGVLCFGLLFIISLDRYLRALMETEVTDKGRLILANLIAVQTYVRETLRPVMRQTLPSDEFVIEAMSTSYVTRKVMSDLNAARDQFAYRRVSLEPRNPEYAANTLEREFISYFQNNPQEQTISQFRFVDEEECYITARPVVFDKRCLVCHGKPEEAPSILLARYGGERGFGRKEGEISGIDMLILPVDRERTAIRKVTVTFVMVFACGTMCLLGFNHFFFDRIMVHNIGRLSEVLRSRFPDEADGTMPEQDDKLDEIETMIGDMERFADRLRVMKEELSNYAATLELKVEERTAELRREAEARISDVQLFLDVTRHFGRGLTHGELLDQVLDLITRKFRAEVSVFHCFISNGRRVRPSGNHVNELDSSKRNVLLEGAGIFDEGESFVPVESTDSVRGALCLRWRDSVKLTPPEQEVLLAVGRQLGIVMEYLEAMDGILRQKAVLESIFEGIADPLFLLDGKGEVVHANETANQLRSDLAGEKDCDLKSMLCFSVICADSDTADGKEVQREIVLPSGRSFVIRAYPLVGYSGVGKYIVYARDNTVEKTMLARLQQGEKALAVGKLAAGLAHEINNPLGVILCYARIMWNDGKSENAEDLDIIIRHSLQAQKVLQDLMRFARPKPERMGPVNLSEAVSFIVRVFRVKAAKQNIVIQSALPMDIPPIIGDAGALEQILTNIIMNSMDALEFSSAEKPGKIVISASMGHTGSEVVLTIADNGPGIAEENLSRVFDPFFTTKEVGRGTGLGLSVVYGLVRDMGGRIHAENRNGAVMTIHFQAAREDHARTAYA